MWKPCVSVPATSDTTSLPTRMMPSNVRTTQSLTKASVPTEPGKNLRVMSQGTVLPEGGGRGIRTPEVRWPATPPQYRAGRKGQDGNICRSDISKPEASLTQRWEGHERYLRSAYSSAHAAS